MKLWARVSLIQCKSFWKVRLVVGMLKNGHFLGDPFPMPSTIATTKQWKNGNFSHFNDSNLDISSFLSMYSFLSGGEVIPDPLVVVTAKLCYVVTIGSLSSSPLEAGHPWVSEGLKLTHQLLCSCESVARSLVQQFRRGIEVAGTLTL